MEYIEQESLDCFRKWDFVRWEGAVTLENAIYYISILEIYNTSYIIDSDLKYSTESTAVYFDVIHCF